MGAINQLRKRILKEVHWRASKREFLDRLEQIEDLDDILALPRQYEGAGFYGRFKTSQKEKEISDLVQRVHELAPRVVVEVGTAYGFTLFYWSQCSPQLEHLISLDLGTGDILFRRRMYPLFIANRPGCKYDMIPQNSQLPQTREKLEALLQGRKIDFLFIDADHSYAGVKKDYELYSPLVRSGGLIGFHDIRPKNDQMVYGLWHELIAAGAQTTEVVTDETKCGIGILTVS